MENELRREIAEAVLVAASDKRVMLALVDGFWEREAALKHLTEAIRLAEQYSLFTERLADECQEAYLRSQAEDPPTEAAEEAERMLRLASGAEAAMWAGMTVRHYLEGSSTAQMLDAADEVVSSGGFKGWRKLAKTLKRIRFRQACRFFPWRN